MSQLYEDREWPRARAWLEGKESTLTGDSAGGLLRVLGVPATRGSITPSRCDLAPAAMREALLRYTTFDLLHRCDLRDLEVEDAGDVDVATASPEEGFQPILEAVKAQLRGADALVLLGGDNSLTYPACVAVEENIADCALLTFDAHLDLRHLDNGLLNGNPVRALLAAGLPGRNIIQIGIQSFANSRAYFEVAMDAGMAVIPVEQVANEGIESLTRAALDTLAGRARSIYVDLDLDVQDRAFAPATAGSRAGGLTPLDIRRAAYLCGRHARVRVMDIVELDPERDVNSITALSGAACLLAFASGLLGRRSRARGTGTHG